MTDDGATRPVWLLDVDHVLNVDYPSWPDGQWAARNVMAGSQRYTIRWVPELIDLIRGLIADGVVEVRWCTTWSEYVGVLEALWGLPELPNCFPTRLRRNEANRLKYAQALAVIESGRPLIWTDDDAIPVSGRLRDALTGDGRSLLIRPTVGFGLSSDHMEQILRFIAHHNGVPL